MDITNNLRVITMDNQQWIRVQDVLKKMGYNQNFEIINNLIDKNIDKEYTKSINILLENHSNEQREIYINKKGLIYLCSKYKKWIKNKIFYKSVINLILILF